MNEQVEIMGGSGRDKVEQVEEFEDKVIIWYNDNTEKPKKVEVPKETIEWVGEYIRDLNIGEKHKSSEIHMAYIKDKRIKSKISESHLKSFIQSMKNVLELDDMRISYVIEDLEKNDTFTLMDWKEHQGTRTKRNQNYYKIWWSLKYWKEKGVIAYGGETVVRLI